MDTNKKRNKIKIANAMQKYKTKISKYIRKDKIKKPKKE